MLFDEFEMARFYTALSLCLENNLREGCDKEDFETLKNKLEQMLKIDMEEIPTSNIEARYTDFSEN